MSFTASDAKRALLSLQKATPKARSVRRRIRTNWTGWTQWCVNFEPEKLNQAIRVLAAKCKAEGVTRYADMRPISGPQGRTKFSIATSSIASVRLVEQEGIGETFCRIDVWATR